MSETQLIITQTTLLTSPSSLVRRSLSRQILSKVYLVFLKFRTPINITDGANGSVCPVNSASSFAATFSRLSKQHL